MLTLRPGLSGDDPVATIRLPGRSLSSQSHHLASTDNLTRTTKRQSHTNKDVRYILGYLTSLHTNEN